MNFIATVIVCAGVLSPLDCQEDNARATMRLPERFNSFISCVVAAQQFVAQQSLIHDDDYIRVYCTKLGESK